MIVGTYVLLLPCKKTANALYNGDWEKVGFFSRFFDEPEICNGRRE
jgi:hypothetical protein